MMIPGGGGGIPMGGGMGAGIPDPEGNWEQPDPMILQAMLAGALPGGPMGMAGMGPPCPSCGAPTADDGSCPTCGMPAADSGPGAMDPNVLAALLGQPGAQPPAPGGVEAIPPPGDQDTTGSDGDEASLQQLMAMLQMLQQGGQGGMPPGMMAGGTGAGLAGAGAAGAGLAGAGAGGAGALAGRSPQQNPLLAAMGRG
jgi:hypothetical protein